MRSTSGYSFLTPNNPYSSSFRVRRRQSQSMDVLGAAKPRLFEASGHRQQSNIPAPASALKLPSTSSTSLAKKSTIVATSSSRQEYQQKAAVVYSKQHSTSVAQGDQQSLRPRRGSYTISGGSTSGGSPIVISSGPSTPDDDPDTLTASASPVGRLHSDILNSTVTRKGQSFSPYRQTDLCESEFRQHLNRPVCIGGEKRGVLRYFGPLHMVDGLFCGIELDESVGQHDGKIDGRRYFHAGCNRGIFAPMEKVDLLEKEPVRPEVMIGRSDAELTIPPDAEYLTDVEPHLMCHSFLDQSAGIGNESFDLSESLMYLKSSRFPGMDISMTPQQLAAQLRGEDREDNEEDERSDDGLHPEDLEAAYLAKHRHPGENEYTDDIDDDSVTPVMEQPPRQLDDTSDDFKALLTASTPNTDNRLHAEKTSGNPLNTTVTFSTPRSSGKRADAFSKAETTARGVKERPISTISADTGYQGDTEYETQSGRSASPREMDVTFERKQVGKGNAIDGASSSSRASTQQQKHEKHQTPSKQAVISGKDDDGIINGSFESLSCETTVRDSGGRVVKVLLETKRVPKARLHDLDASDGLRSLVQLPDVGASTSDTFQSTSQDTAPSSPSKTKRTKSESIESQRKPAKSPKVSDGGNKENSQRDDNSRPSSGVGGGSPARRRGEKAALAVQESAKKIIKAPAKPSKHSEIMAKLQESMAQDKQKPKKEVKSKFMAALAGTTPARSDDRQHNLLPTRPSLLPTPRSRASSTASSLVGSATQNGYGQELSSANASDSGGNVTDARRVIPAPKTNPKRVTTPSEEQGAPAGDQMPLDPFKVHQSPIRKGIVATKKVATTVGLPKNLVTNGASDTEKKKSALAVVKKTPNTGIGQTRVSSSARPPSSSGRMTNGDGSHGSVQSSSSTTPRQPVSQRKSPTRTTGKDNARLKELEAQAEQLKLAKERLCNSAKGFEALSVLIRYYAEKVLPGFHSSLKKANTDINSMKQRTDELTKANEYLLAEKTQMSEVHSKTLKELCQDYEQKLKKLEDDLRLRYEQKTNELSSRHDRELAKIHDENARDREHRNKEFERQRLAEMESFEVKVANLQEQHGREVVDLKALHQNVADDLLRRFEDEKATLGLKVDELHKLCDRYKLEARHLEETLAKDTEKKMSAVSDRLSTYQSEIDSLRAVLEMKNQEIHDLRSKSSLLEKDLEDLPKCRTKIALLEQKNAELKEALDLKKQAEKLFYQQHSDLLQSCERERERNQRLSMDKEQLEFKLQKLIMSQSAYETPMNRVSSDESETDAAGHRSRTTPRPGSAAAAGLKDKPMSQSLIQIYAESSPWSPRSATRTGPHHDNKDLPVTVYMAAQDGDVAKVLQFDGEDHSPSKIKDGANRAAAHSSSDSLSSPQTPPRGAKSVDKVASPKRRISPLRRRNVSMSGGVAPMPATPEHPCDYDTPAERVSSEPPPECPLSKRSDSVRYDGHDPQDPAPPLTSMESSTTVKTGGISTTAGWTDSGIFTTSCISDTQEIITFGGSMEHDSAATTLATAASTDKCSASVDAVAPGQSVTAINDSSKIPKKHGTA